MSEDGSFPLYLTDERGVKKVLEVCGCNEDQTNALIGQGLAVMKDFLVLRQNRISVMCSDITRGPRGVETGKIIATKLETLVKWYKEKKHEGRPLDADEFDEDTLDDFLDRAEVNQM